MNVRVAGIVWLLSVLVIARDAAFGQSEVRRSLFESATSPGSINGQQAAVLIDTGAACSSIVPRLIQHLDLHVVKQRKLVAPSGVLLVPVYETVGMGVDGVGAFEVQPVAVSLDALKTVGLVSCDAIAGMDVLNNLIVVIQGRRVSVTKALPKEFTSILVVTASTGGSGYARIPVMIAGIEEGGFLVDSGMSDSVQITERLAVGLVKSKRAVGCGETKFADAAGVHSSKRFVIREMDVGGVTFRDVPATVGSTNSIGQEVLQHLSLVLDFPKRQILIGKPPHDVVDTFPMNASGMHLAFDENIALNVVAVRPESPAAEAKVEVGDIVVSLDGKQPVDLSIDEVQEILARNGQTIGITFRRGDELRTVDLPLKLAFDYPPDWAAMDAEQRAFEKFLEESEAKPKVEDNP